LKVLVPGGCGYIGAMLVPLLLADGHEVTVYDPQWFGSGHLPDNPTMRFIRGDVRETRGIRDACVGQDAVVYLASLSNNTMCEREPRLHDAVNRDAVPTALFAARISGVKRFIYASSVAAYGSSNEDANETRPLAPSTPYGSAKQYAEDWTLHYNDDDFTTVVTRSASVCGYSVHQRLDLTVNKMVHDAMRLGVIKVNGGQQKRSHIHIHDICRAYRRLLDVPSDKIAKQAFNFVAENLSVLDTAKIVAEATGAAIEIGPATDDRSYTVDGTKARQVLDFTPKRTVRDAVRDLKARFDAGYWKDSMTNQFYQNLADGLV
jgi:nucleoside-diphosphate-sugar epimerase